ncbi:hypothetical protein BH11PAT1_BH11PAT1_6460 [soil metagenome]
MDINNTKSPISPSETPIQTQSSSNLTHNQRGFFPLILGLLVPLLLVGGGAYYLGTQNKISTQNVNTPPTITPSNTVQPSTTVSPPSSPEKIIRKVSEKEGSFLIQKINLSTVEGLWYEQYPIENVAGTPKTLNIGDDIGYSCEGISEKLTSIHFSKQTITFTKNDMQPPNGGCPKCLASNTWIDTPNGHINVKDIRVGDKVWSITKSGNRVSSKVKKISSTIVPQKHHVTHLVLSNGSSVWVSPNHPTIDKRTIGELHIGDSYNDLKIISTDSMSYWDEKTYDILPDNDTGFYYANGILLGSTLTN